ENCTLRKTTTTGNNAALVQMGQHSRGTSVGTDDFNTGRYSPNPVGATFTQCDFIGGTEVNQAVRLDTGRAGWVVKTLRFTGCNFYQLSRYVFNTKDFHFPGNDYKLGGEVDR